MSSHNNNSGRGKNYPDSSSDEEDSFQQNRSRPRGQQGGGDDGEGLESVIQVMNQLYDVGHRINMEGNVKISLPQIVVCGSQSSGKTSVLESVSGEEFLPRGIDIQTRCPIVLQLIHTNDDTKWVEFPHIKGKKFTDMTEVREEVQRINKEIIDSKQVVSEDPITIRLYSPHVPNLTLCDLPGLVENPTKDQPPELVEKIKTLVYEYISNENCIILAISAATEDIADSRSIRLSREVDPHGQRTLGVLTKLDLMDKGTNANEVLLGNRINLDLGIVGVVNRGFLDVQQGKSLEDQLINERRFLETHYPSLASTNGTPYLIKKISRLLMKTIQRTLPGIKSVVEQQIEGQQQILAELGEPDTVIEDPNAVLLTLLTQFADAYCAQLDGRRRNLDLTSLNASAKIKLLFDRKLGAEFERLVAANQLSDEEIDIAIHNSRALHSRHVDYDDAFQELAKQEIKKLAPYVNTCAREVCKEMRVAIETSCDAVIKNRYPRVYQKIKQTALELINERFSDCKSYLEDYINAEASIARTIKGSFRDKNGGYIRPEPNENRDSKGSVEEMNENYTFVGDGSSTSNKEPKELKKEKIRKRNQQAKDQNEERFFSDDSGVGGSLELEDAQIHRANVRKDIKMYFHGTKMQIMEHVARGIIYKLVYGTSDRMSKYLLSRYHGTKDAEYLLVNTNEEELRERRKATSQLLDDYEQANRVIDLVLERVDSISR